MLTQSSFRNPWNLSGISDRRRGGNSVPDFWNNAELPQNDVLEPASQSVSEAPCVVAQGAGIVNGSPIMCLVGFSPARGFVRPCCLGVPLLGTQLPKMGYF
jgi:hypothetical protein